MENNYKAWRDRGGNIGVQCLVCKRTAWNDDHFDRVDPMTGTVCDGCIELKTAGVLQTEIDLHQDEIEQELDCEHESSQQSPRGV